MFYYSTLCAKNRYNSTSFCGRCYIEKRGFVSVFTTMRKIISVRRFAKFRGELAFEFFGEMFND